MTMARLLKKKTLPMMFILLALLFVIPLTGASTYILHIFIMIFMYIALAESWNMFSGLSGYMNFGHIVYFGIGAYTLALTGLSGLPIFLTIPLSGVTSFLLALGLSYPFLKLRGAHFAITTLATMSVVQVFFLYFSDITGGGRGLTLEKLILGIGYHKEYYYYYFLILALVVTYIAYKIKKSKLGFGLMIIKEDEDAAESIGINATLYKRFGYSITAFIAGITGALFAYLILYIDPMMVFDVAQATMVMLMVILGGVGTISGPILGAVIITLVDSILRSYFLYWHLFIYSMMLLTLILLKPEGIKSILQRVIGRALP